MNTLKKRANTIGRRNLNSLCLLLFSVLLFLCNAGEVHAQDKYLINHIYTDYLGFWSSGVNNINEIRPDYSHHLLGFAVGNTTYSTGVDDAVLTSYGVVFKPMNFQALPVVDMKIPDGDYRYVMFGEMQDGLHNEVIQKGIPFPFSLPVTLYDVMTDGTQGLDLSTGVTNMAGVNMEFPTSIEGANLEKDGVPDILVTQTADPSKNNIDEIWFAKEDGSVIGNKIEIDQFSLDYLGETMNDFYDPNTGVVDGGFINSDRKIRISGYDLYEFGINENNYKDAQKLIYDMGGTSDPAFVAFNTDLIKILVANNDVSQTDFETPVEIDVLQNDHMPAPEDLEVSLVAANSPSNGTVKLDPDTHMVTYIPDPGFTGVDNFKYKISDSETSDVAMVTVVVGAADLVVTKEMSNELPEKGDPLEFTVTVRNDGPYDALVVRVNDLLPAGYTYKDHIASAGSYSPLTGVWFVGTLSADKEAEKNSATLTLEVTVNTEGPYTNTAIAETVNYDPNLDNNEASVTPGSLPSASLRVGCASGYEHQQVNIELTGEAPWELVYTFDGEEDVILSGIMSPTLSLDLGEGGKFYLKSVKDDFGNKVEYPINPTSRVQVNPCYVVSNPSMRSRAKKL